MDFQTRLLRVEQALTGDEIQAFAFLCVDLLGKAPGSVSSARELFSRLTDQGVLSAEEPYLLADLLNTIQRRPLIRELGLTDLPTTRGLISPYRQLLYDLSENITEDELDKMKFLLNDRLSRRKQKAMTTLEVFLEMEHKDMLNSTNLDQLKEIIKVVSPVLIGKIHQFETESSMEPVPEETSQLERPRSASEQLTGNWTASLLPKRSVSCGGSGNDETPLIPPSYFSPSLSSQSSQNAFADVPRVPFSLDESLTCLQLHSLDNSNATAQGADHSAAFLYNRDEGHFQTGSTLGEGLGAYPMSGRKRGFCLIINNYNFQKSRKALSNREGTHIDERGLTSVFEWLGFEMLIERDCSGERMLSVLKALGRRDHGQMDCLVCCVLSHGLEGSVYGVDGHTVDIREITEPFGGIRCSSLVEKPKLFFIQACQGTDEQQAVTVQTDSPGPDRAHSSTCSDAVVTRKPTTSIASDADFLMGMATVPSFASFRDKKQGTWYIQALCHNLTKMVPSGCDLVTILTKVNDDVSRKTDTYGTRKQMPQPAFSLRRKVVFPVPERPPPFLP